MLFDTLGYWVFFAAALLLTALRDRPARLALVALSYVFYASWDWRFCAPLAGSTATRISPRLAICFPSRTRLTTAKFECRILRVLQRQNFVCL